MGQPVPRTRLGQLAQRAHLSLPEFVNRFHATALRCGEGDVEISERQAKRWLAGVAATPRPVCRRILEQWWGEPVSRLLGPPDGDAVEVATALSEEELIMNAGRDAMDHALNAAASTLDPSALEQLHAAARYAGRAYYTTSPWTMFTDLVRLRDTLYELLDRTTKPQQQTELYLLAGLVCAHLANVCHALGRADVAEKHARAAYTYGNLIDHPSLCAWARYLQVYLMLSTGRPRQGANLAEASLDITSDGTARAFLYASQARALSSIGARQEVQAALGTASDELQRGDGGTFLDDLDLDWGFDQTLLTLYAASSFVHLGDGDQAEAQCTIALQLFGDMPDADRWIQHELAARVDLATARILRGDLAGTGESLGPVFAVAPELRTEAVARKLGNLGRMLGAARYRNAAEATRIGEAIEDFTARRLPLSTAE